MLSLIWHSVTRRKILALSTVISIAVTVGILFALYLLDVGVSTGLETEKNRMGADIMVLPSETDVVPEDALFTGAPLNVYMPRETEAKVAEIQGVTRVTSQLLYPDPQRGLLLGPKRHAPDRL